MITFILSFINPFAIRYLFICDPILYLSILGLRLMSNLYRRKCTNKVWFAAQIPLTVLASCEPIAPFGALEPHSHLPAVNTDKLELSNINSMKSCNIHSMKSCNICSMKICNIYSMESISSFKLPRVCYASKSPFQSNIQGFPKKAPVAQN